MSTRVKISSSFSYIPLEETIEIIPRKKQLFIGIPKEDTFSENRIALTPDAVSVLIQNGHEVVVEHNAGEHAYYSDKDFSEAGAKIAYDKAEVFQSDIVIKSAPISEEEICLLQAGKVVISPIHLPFLKAGMMQQLVNKKIIAIAFDSIKDDSGTYPIVRSMSQIAGSSAIIEAAKYLSTSNRGVGVLLGGISGVPPAQVVVIGAGIVGESATRTALGLGANVMIFDNSIYRLMRLQNNVGQRLYTSVIDPNELKKVLPKADVVIGALKPINGVTPLVITEEMVGMMKSGSVIIDVSIDRGGCVETSRPTTHDNPVFTKYDVIHYCVPNIASGVARTASRAISNVLMPIVLDIAGKGGVDYLLKNKSGIRNGVYLYKGMVTNQHIAKRFDLKYTDLDLIMNNFI
ncbi:MULTISPECIES: alanine dehydrogenase [Edaphocola]|jgi:alanine dehydrogenase|uniref:alanine dehydrogenase n=1 Tax=Edaphocola TaxID=2601681 RepID=UPI00100B1BF7|nr:MULTISPECIES: alanine dehydrogenase [Edaphocola]